MKNKVLLITGLMSLAILSACGGSGGPGCTDSKILGEYELNGGADVLTFTEDCRWSSQACESSGTFPSFTKDSGSAKIQVTSSPIGSDGGCLDVGTATCIYALSAGDSFSFVCSQD